MYSSSVINGLIRTLVLLLIICVLPACQNVPQTKTAAEDAEQKLYEQATGSLKAGKTDLAIEQFEQLLKQNPAAKHAYTNLGLLYAGKQDFEQAKQAFLNAIEQDKNDAIAYNHLAVIQRQQGQFQQAKLNYEKAINADPAYANAYLNLGILLDIYLQDLPKALEQYVKYQQLTANSNKDVEKWLIDIKRRIDNQKDIAK